jgi:SmpA / OmlA family
MSMRLKKRWLLLLCVVVMATGILVWLIWPSSRLGPDNFKRIQVGMSQAEVYKVLGGPPAIYTSGPGYVMIDQTGFEPSCALPGITRWVDQSYMIVVHFDENNKVFLAVLFQGTESAFPIDWIRKRFGI